MYSIIYEPFTALHDAIIILIFIESQDSLNNLKNSLQGYVGGVWVPFQNKDACPTITPACPIPISTDETFTFGVAVSDLYPTVSQKATVPYYNNYGIAD